MSQYEATFEIDAKADAQVVRTLAERVYDTVREETREVSGGEPGQSEMLREFEAIREATGRLKPGKLTVRLEQYDEQFDR